MRKFSTFALGIVAGLAISIVTWTAVVTNWPNNPPYSEPTHNVYINALASFQFAYPDVHRVLSSDTRSAAIGDEAGYVVITVDVDQTQSSLDEWSRVRNADSISNAKTTSIKSITLGGVLGLHIVEREYDSGPAYELVTIKRGLLIRIGYRGLTEAEAQQLRDSFEFTD